MTAAAPAEWFSREPDSRALDPRPAFYLLGRWMGDFDPTQPVESLLRVGWVFMMEMDKEIEQ
jgi:hypothetical protein